MELCFVPIDSDSIPILNCFLSRASYRTCDYSVGGIYMWRKFFQMGYCVVDDVLFLNAFLADGEEVLLFPVFNGVSILGLKLVDDYCHKRGIPVKFTAVPADALALLKAHYRRVDAREERDWFDYVYRSTDLSTLKGNGYSSIRNHINRFIREYSQYAIEEINSGNIHEVKAFYLRYCDSITNKEPDIIYIAEMNATHEVIDAYSALPFVGLLLRIEGKVVGFTIGEVIQEMLFVHIEKVDRAWHGAYQYLSREFVLRYSPSSSAYVNREEDVGDPALRRAKMAYQPYELLEKYTVCVYEL